MSRDNKDKSFDLLAHEKKISEIYHYKNTQRKEQPSAQLDSKIMTSAKQQISENARALAKEQKLNPQPPANKNIENKVNKSWQRPFSLVASVGILGLLFITQRDYFIPPINTVVGESGISNQPDILVPDISQSVVMSDEITADQSFKTMQMKAATQNHETLENKNITAAAGKRMLIKQAPRVLNEQMLNKTLHEGDSVQTTPILLSDMVKLAEELATLNVSELEANAASIKMQQTLFEHLTQYKKSHMEFKITEKYLNVLTEKQVEQLKAMHTEAVLEN